MAELRPIGTEFEITSRDPVGDLVTLRWRVNNHVLVQTMAGRIEECEEVQAIAWRPVVQTETAASLCGELAAWDGLSDEVMTDMIVA